MPSSTPQAVPRLGRRTLLAAALGTVLLLATQLSVSIPSPASVGGTRSLALAEPGGLLLVLLTAWLLAHGRWRARLGRLGRYLVGASAVLVGVWVLVTLARVLVEHRRGFSITMLELILIGVCAALLIIMRAVPTRAVALAVGGFFLVVHAWLLVMLALGGRVRGVGLLGNVNVYIGLALLAIPIALAWGLRALRGPWRWLLLANVALAVAVVLLSGSRFGGPAIVLCLLAFVMLVDDRPWRRRLATLGVLALGAAVCAGIFIARNDQHLSDFGRTINLESVIHGTEPDTKDIEEERAKVATPPPSTPTAPSSRPERPTSAGDPDRDVPPPGLNILNHTRVQARSIAVAKEHWLLGIGRPGPYFDGWGYHPAHNVALESLLNFGAVGVGPYFALLLGGAGMLALGRWTRPVRAYLLGFAGLIGFSFFQPLLSEFLVVQLILWSALGVTYRRRNDDATVDDADAPRAETPAPAGTPAPVRPATTEAAR